MTATANLMCPPLRMVPPTLAQSFLISAQTLMPSARCLAASTDNELHAGLSMLAGHILECLLKAYLVQCGGPSRELGHDIEKLWVTAHEKGLDISASPPHWVRILHTLHAWPFSGRYSTGRDGRGLNGKSYPIQSELMAGLSDLLGKIERVNLAGL